MKDEGVGRRDFLRKVPLFGAGLALGLSALENIGEVPKARKLAGEDVEPFAVCDDGTCNVGDTSSCVTGACKVGNQSSCNAGACRTGNGGTCKNGTCNNGT